VYETHDAQDQALPANETAGKPANETAGKPANETAGKPTNGAAGEPANEAAGQSSPGSMDSPLTGRLARFARRHAVFGVLLVIATAIRAFAMVGYPGGLEYPDSTSYLIGALGSPKNHFRLEPGGLRPIAYSALLRVLEPFHSFELVVGLQHLMGLTVGVLVYALLRRYGLPGWGAALAAAPVLLSAYAIQMEHFLLSDTLFTLLIMLAVVVLLWWPSQPMAACAVLGLLLAAALLDRSEGTPLVLVFVVCMLIRFKGWRTIAGVVVMCVAFAIPIVEYADWFDSVNGSFGITDGTGGFLYGVVSTFADCAKINPPADLRRLCPTTPESARKQYPPYYIWTRSNPMRKLKGGEFGSLGNTLGTEFALRAIEAQPLDYLGVVTENFLQSFLLHGDAHARKDSIAYFNQQGLVMFSFPAKRTQGWDAGLFHSYDPTAPDMQVVQPYAGWVLTYQRYVVVSGPLLAVILLVGLLGLIVAWRRIGGPALPAWLVGFALLVIPPATDGFDARYVICAIPPLCIAAGLGVREIAGQVQVIRLRRKPPTDPASGLGEGEAAVG
jgi:hypothetical protein